jgi:hypothetical protein
MAYARPRLPSSSQLDVSGLPRSVSAMGRALHASIATQALAAGSRGGDSRDLWVTVDVRERVEVRRKHLDFELGLDT